LPGVLVSFCLQVVVEVGVFDRADHSISLAGCSWARWRCW
jgi:hypothetical protein